MKTRIYAAPVVKGLSPISLDFASWKWLSFDGTRDICLNFMEFEFFGRQRGWRVNTACCVNKMAVKVAGSVSELVNPVMPATEYHELIPYPNF